MLNSLSKPPNILVLTGLAVSIVGCFLPWAEFRWSSNQLVVYPETEIGMGLSLGVISFFGCTFAAFFQLVHQAGKRARFALAILLGSLIAMTCSGTWISELGAFEHSYGVYTTLYGADVTLLGSIIASATVTLFFTVKAEKTALLAQNTAKN